MGSASDQRAVPKDDSFGTRLRELRLEADLTLEALGERAGVSERAISDIERGVSLTPRRATVDALAAGLGLDEAEAKSFLRVARAGRKAKYGSDGGGVVAPHRVNDFTGRDAEVSSIVGMLTEHDEPIAAPVTVVVTGAPGVGKTTAAWEAFGRVPDRWHATLFVDLDGFGALPLTQYQVIAALLSQMPDAADPPRTLHEAAQAWRVATISHPVAILLDNAATEAQIRAVLSAGADSAIIITSRRSLSGLEGAQRLFLEPFRRAESIALLAKLVPAHQQDPAAFEGLAEVCGDVPLALRIVGNRIASRPAWRASDFLLRLKETESRLRLLVAGDLAVEAAFALSYDNMQPETARLFCSISVIESGPFDARMAAATEARDVSDTESRLEDLTDLGVLEARGGDRYRLHDLLRLFAHDRLRTTAGMAGVITRRNALRTWTLATLRGAGSWFEPGRNPETGGGAAFRDAEEAAAWIRGEVAHWWTAFRHAAALGEDGLVVDVADSLHWFSDLWTAWGHWHEFFSLAVVSARRLADPVMEATHLGYVAWAELIEVGDDKGALRTATEALGAADRANDDVQRGWAQFYLSWASQKLGLFTEAVFRARCAIDAFTRAGDDEGLAVAISRACSALYGKGDHEKSMAELVALRDSLSMTPTADASVGLRVAMYSVHVGLGRSYMATGNYEGAIVEATRSIDLATSLGDITRIANSLSGRSQAHLRAGNRAAAAADVRAAKDLLGPNVAHTDLHDALRDELLDIDATS